MTLTRSRGLRALLAFTLAFKAITATASNGFDYSSPTDGTDILVSEYDDIHAIPHFGSGPGSSRLSAVEPRNEIFRDLWREIDARPKKSEQLQHAVMGIANSSTSSAVKDWFAKRHATAQLAIGGGDDWYRTSSFDLLLPLVDTQSHLFFTQMGIRRSKLSSDNYRNVINIGLGSRYTTKDWMLGVNTFYDRDVTGGNSRLGVGAEAWTDFLKLSGNAYRRLSEERDTALDMGNERSSTGWDLRLEAFFPNYPELSTSLIYEQYYGSGVGLFGNAYAQQNPNSMTAGVSYTPVPLVSFSADHQRGQDGLSATHLTLGFNFELGTSIGKQLSPKAVRSRRLLSNARYDLISRRNDVVIDYNIDIASEIKIPTEINGVAGSMMSFPITVSGSTVKNFTWVGTAFPYATVYGGGANGGLRLPKYNPLSSNSYTLKAVGTDGSGNPVQSNFLQVRVDPFNLKIQRSANVSLHSGDKIVRFTATLLTPDGYAVSNSQIRWRVSGDATIISKDVKTGIDGKATLDLERNSAEMLVITVEEPQGAVFKLTDIMAPGASLAVDNFGFNNRG